jgi:hypothetical protein
VLAAGQYTSSGAGRYAWSVSRFVLRYIEAKAVRCYDTANGLSGRKTRFCNGALAVVRGVAGARALLLVWRSEGFSMAKRDGRRKSEAAKAATKKARIARASARRRVINWSGAASAAEAAGYPLNVALHITWSTLIKRERRDDHFLSLPAVERERRIWSALRLVAARAGVPWLAARAPEHDRRGRGLHLHLVLHLPNVAAIRDALGVVERLTGATAAWIIPSGRTLRGNGRHHHGVVAMSACGGWFMQRRVETLGGSGAALAAYAAKGDGKALVEGQHRLSNDLTALARTAA